MKITWFGHSAFRVDTGDAAIMIDPFLSGNPTWEGSEFKHRLAGEIRNREHRLEYSLQAFIDPPASGFLDLQKLVVRFLLHLNEVRHHGNFNALAEYFADAFATCDRMCLSHVFSLSVNYSNDEDGLSEVLF
jgi:hypothetical protein